MAPPSAPSATTSSTSRSSPRRRPRGMTTTSRPPPLRTRARPRRASRPVPPGRRLRLQDGTTGKRPRGRRRDQGGAPARPALRACSGKPTGKTGAKARGRARAPPSPRARARAASRASRAPVGPASRSHANRTITTGTKMVAPEQMMDEAREFITRADARGQDRLRGRGARRPLLLPALEGDGRRWRCARADELGRSSPCSLAALVIGIVVVRVRQSPAEAQPAGALDGAARSASFVCVALHARPAADCSSDTTEVPSAHRQSDDHELVAEHRRVHRAARRDRGAGGLAAGAEGAAYKSALGGRRTTV